jgi:hypothetical protein
VSESTFVGYDVHGPVRLRILSDRLEVDRARSNEQTEVVSIPFDELEWVEVTGPTHGATSGLSLILSHSRSIAIPGLDRMDARLAYEALMGAAKINGRWGY